MYNLGVPNANTCTNFGMKSGLKISITVAVNAYTNNKDLGQTAHPSDLLSGQHVTFRYRLEPRESYNSV